MGKITLLDSNPYTGGDNRLNLIDVMNIHLYPLCLQDRFQDLGLLERMNRQCH